MASFFEGWSCKNIVVTFSFLFLSMFHVKDVSSCLKKRCQLIVACVKRSVKKTGHQLVIYIGAHN